MILTSNGKKYVISSIDEKFDDVLKVFIESNIGLSMQIPAMVNTLNWIAGCADSKLRKSRIITFIYEMQIFCGFLQNYADQLANGLITEYILKTPASPDLEPFVTLDLVKTTWCKTNPNILKFHDHKEVNHHAAIVCSYITADTLKKISNSIINLSAAVKLEGSVYLFVSAAFAYYIWTNFRDSVENVSSKKIKFATHKEFSDACYLDFKTLQTKVNAALLLERPDPLEEKIVAPAALEFKILSKCSIYQGLFNNDFIYTELNKIEQITDAEEKKRKTAEVYKNLQYAAVFLQNMADDLTDGRLRAEILATSNSVHAQPLKSLNVLEFKFRDDFILDPKLYITCDGSPEQKAQVEILITYLHFREVIRVANNTLLEKMQSKFTDMFFLYLDALFVHRNFDNPICQLEGKPAAHAKMYYVSTAFIQDFVGLETKVEPKVKSAAEKNTMDAEKNFTSLQDLRDYNQKRMLSKLSAKERIKQYQLALEKERAQKVALAQARNAENERAKLESAAQTLSNMSDTTSQLIILLKSTKKSSPSLAPQNTSAAEAEREAEASKLKALANTIAFKKLNESYLQLQGLYDGVIMHAHINRSINSALRTEIMAKYEYIFVKLQAEIVALGSDATDKLSVYIAKVQHKVQTTIDKIKPRLTGLNKRLAVEKKEEEENKLVVKALKEKKQTEAATLAAKALTEKKLAEEVRLAAKISRQKEQLKHAEIKSKAHATASSLPSFNKRTLAEANAAIKSGVASSSLSLGREISASSSLIISPELTSIPTIVASSADSFDSEIFVTPASSPVSTTSSIVEKCSLVRNESTTSNSSASSQFIFSPIRSPSPEVPDFPEDKEPVHIEKLFAQASKHFQQIRQILDLATYDEKVTHYALLYHFWQSFKLLNEAVGFSLQPRIVDAVPAAVLDLAARIDAINGNCEWAYFNFIEFNETHKFSNDPCELILVNYIPIMKQIMQPMFLSAHLYIEKFSLEFRALEMLINLCGELEIGLPCVDSNFQAFLNFCHKHNNNKVTDYPLFFSNLTAVLAFDAAQSYTVTKYIAKHAVVTATGLQFFAQSPQVLPRKVVEDVLSLGLGI